MKKEIYKRNILIDEPSDYDAFQGKGHERTAKSLSAAISQFEDADRAIGLDGPWGSGKSSIVAIAASHLDKKSKGHGKKFHFFTFDIWKSQGTAFRRAFLEHLVSWALLKFPQRKSQLRKIEEKIRGKTRHVTTDNNTRLDWYGVLVVLALPFLPIFYFWTKKVYDETVAFSGVDQESATTETAVAIDVITPSGGAFLTSAPMIVLYCFLGITVLKSVWKYFRQNGESKVSFLEYVSQTILITAKQYEKQKSTQHIREVDPNDFEFQATLSEIIATIQDSKTRVVLVLDNIDRLPLDQIDDHWSAIRSIFSRNFDEVKHSKDGSITAIVPYDRHHIQGVLPSLENGEANSETQEPILSKRELFSKTFDEILFVAPPVMSNSREFFEARIADALPNFGDSEELFKVYLIFSTYMQTPNGHFTPRQIISFINDLTSLYSIHQGEFPLSTVAVYTCLRERIAENPLLLTDSAFVNGKLRRLAPDPDIEENLAAILYNVDKRLALEILLDSRISAAAIQEDSSDLIELSKSHGFDLRVDEVVRAHVKEWIGAGSFGEALMNFSNLFKDYEGVSKKQTIDSLIYFFKDVPELRPTKQNYLPYFSLIDMCPPERLEALLTQMISKVIETLVDISKGAPNFEAGTLLVEFIDSVKSYTSAKVDESKFRSLLREFNIPKVPDFVLGFASKIDGSEYSINDFNGIGIALSDSDSVLEDFARGNPHLSEFTFQQLLLSNVVSSTKWVEVSNSIVELLKEPNIDSAEVLNGYLGTLAAIWTSLPHAERQEVNLSELTESALFYLGLHKAYEHQMDMPGLGHAVFLVKHPLVGQELPTTGEHSRGAITSEMQTAYQWFETIYDGETELDQSQVDRIMENARKTFRLGSWLDAARNSGDELIQKVALASLRSPNLPRFALTTFLQNFSFSKELLGEDFKEVLSKYDDYINKREVAALELKDIPLGLLYETESFSGSGWETVHKKVESDLLEIDGALWSRKLSDGDHDVCLVAEKAQSSGVEMDSAPFRNAFLDVVSRVLKGEVSSFSNEINFDEVFYAIPESFHSDIFRQCREKVSDVTNGGLSLATEVFPKVLFGVVSTGEKISADEKDNVVRNLLCSALEAKNTAALDIFLSLGRRKISDFIKKSQQATRDKLNGAMALFAKECEDREYLQRVSDLINGKRETKSLWGIWFPHLYARSEDSEAEE